MLVSAHLDSQLEFMPFTLSHPAAILPLHRWGKSRLPLAALVVGSMSPDVAYFLPVSLGTESHSLAGILYFCWPIGLALWMVFEFLLRRPTLALMPDLLRARFPERRIEITAALLLKVSAALMLGASTHIAWDAFTHATSPLVSTFPILTMDVADFAGQSVQLYRALQHLSTVFGLGVLGYCTIIWFRRGSTEERRRSTDGLPNAWRVSAIAAIVAASLVGASIDHVLHSPSSLERQLFHICIGGMTGFALAWCATSVLIILKWRVSAVFR